MHRISVLWSVWWLAVLAPVAFGGQIRWTASGTVEGEFGEGFGEHVTAGDPVEIEFSYDNRSPRIPVAGVNGFFNHVEFREDVNLELKVTVGDQTWRGTIESGNAGGTRTIEMKDFQIGGTPGGPTFDDFIVTLSTQDGAEFPEFPGTPPGPQHLMQVRFRDRSEDGSDIPDYIGSETLACASDSISRITEGNGSLSTAVGAFEFTIDPDSIATEIVDARRIELRAISFADDQVTLTWGAIPGRFYAIQYLDDFLCWRELFSIEALEEEVTEFVTPFGFPATQLYRVIELE